MSNNFKLNSYVWCNQNDKKVCYKVKKVYSPEIFEVERGLWIQQNSNYLTWKPVKNDTMHMSDLKKMNNKFNQKQLWKCVYCGTVNTGNNIKCQGTWYGTMPLPHTKFGSLANNQQYFLWGGEKNGKIKFPPSVLNFKYKDWKADSQRKILKKLYKDGIKCNAIRCTHISHLNRTDNAVPQIIIYPYPNGLSYYPGEMVGHVRTHNESICPRCFNYFPEYQMPFSMIRYEKNRIRLENERNWWFVEVLFWIKHEILDKNKRLTPKRCEALVKKMYSKIINKIELPDYTNAVYTRLPGSSDHVWYIRNRDNYEISLKSMLNHFVKHLQDISLSQGNYINIEQIIFNLQKTDKLKF